MKNKKNIINIFIIILVTVLLLSKLFLNVRYEGHDTIFHVSNIINLSNTISFDNIFGSNIVAYDFHKFGYGVWLFYPKFPHLIAAYTYLIIKDIYLSMNIVYLITTLLSGIFTYFLAKKIFNDRNIALLSSVIYITVPYHVCEIYTRDAFSENFMFMVLPMIFLGLYNLKDNNYLKFYILFTLGYIIGMNSHLVSMVFNTIFVGIFILYYHKCFFKKDKIKALLISTLIVTGVTLPFLVTLLEHKSLGLYRVYTEIFTTLEGVQSSSLDFKSLYMQEPILNNVLPYFSIVTIILFVFTTINFIFNKKDKYRKDKKVLLLLMVIVITIMCSKVIWEYVPSILLSIQFPWRLLVFLSLMIALYSPTILINRKIPSYLKNILLIVIILISILDGVDNINYFRDEEVSVEEALVSKETFGFQKEYFPYLDPSNVDITKFVNIYTNYNPYLDMDNVGKDTTEIDNMPRNNSFKEYFIDTDEDISTEIISDDFPNMEFVVYNLSCETVIEIPRIYYLGYELVNENGEKIELSNSKNGLLEATIDTNGTYKLNYVKTRLHRVAEFIRLLTVLIVVMVLVVRFVKWKGKKLQF